MQSPLQVVTLLRPNTRKDLLAAAAVSSMVFTATPFLLSAIADQYDVSLGTASLISSFQLGGFVIASWTVGRFVDPSRRLLIISLLMAVAANAGSAAMPWFSGLLALRFLGGVALAVVAWLGWQEVFGDEDRMGDVAVVGPVVGIVGAPVASYLADQFGADAVFVALAIFAALPLIVRGPDRPMGAHAPRKADRSKPLPVARAILLALGALTLGGSAVFVFAAAVGVDEVGLDPWVVSLAFSGNAAVSIPAARYRGRRPLAGLWVLGTGTAALVLTSVTVAPVFLTALVLWGFAFWMGVPGIYKLLAERSANPSDRAGDAQSIMAAGRVFGPAVGAAFIEAGSLQALGIAVGALIGCASLALVYIEIRVPAHSPAPPTDGQAPEVS